MSTNAEQANEIIAIAVLIDSIEEKLKALSYSTREISLAITKLQEGRLWLSEHCAIVLP